MESLEEFTGSNDHSPIIKGKRTKRQRPSSPHGAAVTTSTSSTCGGDGGSGGGSGASGVGCGGDVCSSVPSPTTSGEILSTSTEEDEDMANCLILLAQGLVRPAQLELKNEEEEEEEEEENKKGKFAATIGKSEFYVYECKTCNRTFPSFQALGGHRASHKKPKTTIHGEEKRVPFVEEEEVEKINKISSLPPPTLQTVIGANTKTPRLNNKSKVHECSICGSEFSSGQALGGHMRRHRAPPNTRIPMTVDSSSIAESEEELGSSKRRNILSLDLNLPAPPEDDHHHHHHHHHHHQRDSKFEFTPNKQHLVFSAPALVDCHY